MKRKKVFIGAIFLRIILLTILIIPFSCSEEVCTDSCCGSGFKSTFSVIDSIQFLAGQIDTIPTTVSEKYEFSQGSTNSYRKAALKIEVVITTQSASNEQERNFSLINSAYACSPPLPQPSQKLESISIFSDSTIITDSTVYMSETDLSELFLVAKKYPDQEDISIKEYIEYRKMNSIGFGYSSQYIVLKLRERAVFPDSTLQVQLEMDDGVILNAFTEDFVIN